MANWIKPTEPFKVIDNIYYVGTNGLAVYLITTPQGHILVDTGVPEVTSQIRDNIQKLGFKVTDIKYILNTQAHFDHTGGFAELKKESGAQLVVGERDKPGHTPGCTSWSLSVKDGNDTRSAMIFCSASIALNKLITNPTYPGIIDDYRKTFAWARTVQPEVFL